MSNEQLKRSKLKTKTPLSPKSKNAKKDGKEMSSDE